MKLPVYTLFLICFVFCLSLSIVPVQACDNIIFLKEKDPGAVTALRLEEWIKKKNLEDFPLEVSMEYLNQDQIPELIVKILRDDMTCPGLSGCKYFVLADAKDELIDIAEFTAHSISIEDKKEKGVRNLTVCKNPWDDFDCTGYVWSGKDGSYIEEK